MGANSDAPWRSDKSLLAGAVTIFPLPEPGTGPATITSGPERNLWFTESPVGRIGRVGLDGKVFEYHLPRKGALPAQIVAGSDGNIWFTENFSDRVARMTPKGQVTEFTLPVSGKYEAIVSGPDGNLWIAVNQSGSTPDSIAGAIVRAHDQRRGDRVSDSERRRHHRPHRAARRDVVVHRAMGDRRIDLYWTYHHRRPNHRDLAQPQEVT